jgi:hypothetical protein
MNKPSGAKREQNKTRDFMQGAGRDWAVSIFESQREAKRPFCG